MVQIKYTQLFINNKFVNSVSGKTFTVINPSTEEKLADVQEANREDVEKAIDAAEAAFKHNSEWRKLDASARGRLMHKLANLIERDADYLAQLESLNNGKPLAQAKWDVGAIIQVFRYYGGWADKVHGRTIPADGGRFSYTLVEPVGVCGQIIPWNYPLLMLSWKWAPALATGCTIVMKPAKLTPLTALYMASLVVEAGFPSGVINLVPGPGSTAGNAIVESPRVHKIAFTGSTEVGKEISQKASGTVKRVSLELGGKSPLVVSQHFDPSAGAEIASFGCNTNGGQCCCAATRTFVHESIYEDFVRKTAEIAKRKVVGDPFDERTTQGAQTSQEQLDKILELINSGVKEGARLVAGGHRMKRKGFFVEATVFADVTDNMRIAREEIFGPVQQIFKYKTLDEVIERCNATEYGLAAGILSNDINEAMTFAGRVKAGSVWVNNYLDLLPMCPFGGYKESGHGRELGEDGLHEYSEIKTVTVKINTPQ